MIDYLKGIIIEKSPTSIIVENNGFGYKINISLNSYTELPEPGEDTQIYIHLNLSLSTGRENIELYGFSSRDERNIFSSLRSVSGIGAKLAVSILSSSEPVLLKEAISKGDLIFLQRLKGIGRKTAQRIILELKDKFIISQPSVIPAKEDAVGALVSLGYSRDKSSKVVAEILSENEDIEIEELIRIGLARI